jgi:hypothetical protein
LYEHETVDDQFFMVVMVFSWENRKRGIQQNKNTKATTATKNALFTMATASMFAFFVSFRILPWYGMVWYGMGLFVRCSAGE